MRDIDANPYTTDEMRVATWFSEKGTGGGDDPVGAMIASHEYLAAERNRYKAALEKIASEHTQWSWPRDATPDEAINHVALTMRYYAREALAQL